MKITGHYLSVVLLGSALLASCRPQPIDFPELPPLSERSSPAMLPPQFAGATITTVQIIINSTGNCADMLPSRLRTAELFIQSLGIDFSSTTNPPEAIITVDLKCDALQETYTREGWLLSQSCFSGYDLSGVLAVTVGGTTNPWEDFHLSQPPPARLTEDWCGQTPQDIRELPGAIASLEEQIIFALADLWGPSMFTYFLIDQLGPTGGGDWPHVYLALDMLERMGPNALDAAPTLIATIASETVGEGIKIRALSALTAISGQDFGMDAAKWHRWWQAR